MFLVPFPVYQVLELPFINTRSYYIVYFVFFIALFRDVYRTRPGDGLSREWTQIRFNSRNVHYRVNPKGFRELELNRIRGYSSDLIGANPFLR